MISRPHQLSLILITVITTVGLYWYCGGHSQLRAHQALQARVQAIKADPKALVTLTSTLVQKLEAEPGDVKGWYLLGKLYLQQQRYTDAAASFKQGYLVDKSVKSLLSWQLYAEYLANGQNINREMTGLINTIRKEDPDSHLLKEILGAISTNLE